MSKNTAAYLKFLAGNCTNNQGFTYDDIIKFTPYDVESNHNFIQWIFPLKTKTLHNEYAPILDTNLLKRIWSLHTKKRHPRILLIMESLGIRS